MRQREASLLVSRLNREIAAQSQVVRSLRSLCEDLGETVGEPVVEQEREEPFGSGRRNISGTSDPTPEGNSKRHSPRRESSDIDFMSYARDWQLAKLSCRRNPRRLDTIRVRSKPLPGPKELF